MTIMYLGWHHVVLTQPPDPRVETLNRLHGRKNRYKRASFRPARSDGALGSR